VSFNQFLRILWARKISLLAFAIVGVVIALALSYVLPEKWKATTSIVIDFKGVDPVLGLMLPAQMMPGYMATQLDIIQSHNVALKVVREMKIAQVPAIQQQFQEATDGKGSIEDWVADFLLKSIDVTPSRESSVVQLTYTSPDPQFSAVMANAFAKAYVDTNLELRVQPAKDTSRWFDEQIKTLRANLENAQAKLSAYQREKGIHSVVESMDVENSKLQELSQQLVLAEAQSSDAASKKRQLDRFIASGQSVESLPELLANPLVSNLKNQLITAESRLDQASGQFGRNHPEVQRATAEVESLKVKLAAEIRNVSAGITTQYRIAASREAELRATLDAQKKKLLTANEGRDEMSVLLKEVESAQRAMDAASQRLTTTSLESQASQTNIMILNPAIPPVKKSFPILWLNIPLGVLAGLFLGLNFALVREMLDRRVRNVEDLLSVEGLPVLAVLGKPKRRGLFGILGRRSPALAPA
jgi:chain length determinant protein EpsF